MLKIHKANSLILLLYYNYSHKNDKKKNEIGKKIP